MFKILWELVLVSIGVVLVVYLTLYIAFIIVTGDFSVTHFANATWDWTRDHNYISYLRNLK